MKKHKKITKTDLKSTYFGKRHDPKTILKAVNRLREKGAEIYETDFLQNKDNFMFNMDKPWILSSIMEEIKIMQVEERDKKIETILD